MIRRRHAQRDMIRIQYNKKNIKKIEKIFSEGFGK
jgi:hypothetical protein